MALAALELRDGDVLVPTPASSFSQLRRFSGGFRSEVHSSTSLFEDVLDVEADLF